MNRGEEMEGAEHPHIKAKSRGLVITVPWVWILASVVFPAAIAWGSHQYFSPQEAAAVDKADGNSRHLDAVESHLKSTDLNVTALNQAVAVIQSQYARAEDDRKETDAKIERLIDAVNRSYDSKK